MPSLSAKPFVPIQFCTSFSATASESDLSQLMLLILTAKSDLLMKITTVNCSLERVVDRSKETKQNEGS